MAHEYDQETFDFWDLFPQTFFDKFIELSRKKIIDVGSGPGRDGLILQNAGKDIVCLDASEEMVKLSSSRGLHSILGDFNNLPFAPESFDGVWSYTTLLHVPKKSIDIALKEIYRVLKPEGILGLGLIEGEVEEYRETSGVNLPRWFSFYKKEEVENLLNKNGFKMVHFEIFKPRSKNYLNFIFRKE